MPKIDQAKLKKNDKIVLRDSKNGEVVSVIFPNGLQVGLPEQEFNYGIRFPNLSTGPSITANVLYAQSGDLYFSGVLVGPSTGTNLVVKEEGSSLTNYCGSIDFVGTGITATNSGDDITVTVASTASTANMWSAPETPHADDDEFDGDALNAAWTDVWAISTNASGSFNQNQIDVYDSSFSSGVVIRVDHNQEHSRSWLRIQPPSTDFFAFLKPITLATNCLVWSRLRFMNRISSITNNDSTVGIVLGASTAGHLDKTNYVALFLNESDAGTVQGQFDQYELGVYTGIGNTTNVTAEGQALEYVAIHKVGTTYYGWIGTPSNWVYIGSTTLTFTVAWVGILSANATNLPILSRVSTDFIRFIETDKFVL